MLCLYSQTTRDTEMEEVTRNQEENRKQVETREQEDIQSFPARIPYILIICTHKYYYYHSGTYTLHLSFPHTNIYYHFWHVYLILIISTHKYILSFLASIPYILTHIYRPIYHDNISAPDIYHQERIRERSVQLCIALGFRSRNWS